MPLSLSYFPSYFSISDILATQDRVPSKFEVPVYGLGFLDQSSGNTDIEQGTKLELPCWLARALSSARLRIVKTQLPTSYKEKYREILKADPSVVDLHKLGPRFYELGMHLLPLAGAESSPLATLLTQTLNMGCMLESCLTDRRAVVLWHMCIKESRVHFEDHIQKEFENAVFLTFKQLMILPGVLYQTLRERLRGIMDSAQNSSEDDTSTQIAKLDDLERSLFEVGQRSLRDHKLWLSRRAHILTTSAMVEQHNKRKFSEVDK